MAHYRIFIPNSTASAAADLDRVGLGSLLRADDWQPVSNPSNGPAGMRGKMISWEPDETRPGVDAPRYEFDPEQDLAIEAPAEPTKRLAQGRCWLILEKNRPSTPLDLKRKPAADLSKLIPSTADSELVRLAKAENLKSITKYAGNAIKLADGNEWIFPNMTELPTTSRLNAATGIWSEVVKPLHRTLYDEMLAIFNACKQHIVHDAVRGFTDEQIAAVITRDELDAYHIPRPAAFDDEIARPFICRMLAENYRLTPWIVSELGLLSLSLLWSCLEAITDARELWRLAVIVQKKTATIRSPSPTSPPGDSAASPANRPSATTTC